MRTRQRCAAAGGTRRSLRDREGPRAEGQRVLAARPARLGGWLLTIVTQVLVRALSEAWLVEAAVGEHAASHHPPAEAAHVPAPPAFLTAGQPERCDWRLTGSSLPRQPHVGAGHLKSLLSSRAIS